VSCYLILSTFIIATTVSVACYTIGLIHSTGNQKVCCIVTEINNTFGETHLYVMDNTQSQCEAQVDTSKSLIQQLRYRHIANKEFHVSPFNNVEGDYQFYFSDIQDFLHIRINVLLDKIQDSKQGKYKGFLTQLISKRMTQLSIGAILSSALRIPISSAMIFPRILYQAGRLHYEKGKHSITYIGSI
jgi:cyclopropane-fatty-acyl-phospholipid synthase